MTEHSLVRFADDTKLEGAVFGTLEDRSPSALQRDIFRLKEWSDKDLMKFEMYNCKVLYLGRSKPLINNKGWGPSTWEAGLLKMTWSLADSKLSKNWQGVLAAKKANSMLGCISRSIAIRLSRANIFPCSALVSLRLE